MKRTAFIASLSVLIFLMLSCTTISTPTAAHNPTNTPIPTVFKESWAFSRHPSLGVLYDPTKWELSDKPVLSGKMLTRKGIDAGADSKDNPSECRIADRTPGGQMATSPSIQFKEIGPYNYTIKTYYFPGFIVRLYEFGGEIADPDPNASQLIIELTYKSATPESCLTDAEEVIATLFPVK